MKPNTRYLLLTACTIAFIGGSVNAETIVVDAKKDDWHQPPVKLTPNTSYVISPVPNVRYSHGGGSNVDFHGSGTIAGSQTPAECPGNVQVGGLLVAVFHHDTPEQNVNTHEYFSFPPGRNSATVRVGRYGAAMFFMIADVKNGYADNSGVCKVRVDNANVTVVVDAKKDDWHQPPVKLTPNTSYVISPVPNVRYSHGGGSNVDFHGSGTIAGSQTPAEYPGNVQVGGLLVLVLHHDTAEQNLNTHEHFSFPPGRNSATVRVGRHGAAMFFMIADVKNGYTDNSGVCKVNVKIE